MKKISKAVSILLVAFMLISIVTPVLAVGPDPTNYQGNNSVTTDKIDSLGNQIITIVSTIGSIASVIVLIVLGIKYMMGSAEEKAEYKKTMIPYVVGAALIFAASAFAQVVYQFFAGVSV